MNKIIPLILALTLLSGCSLTTQIDTVIERYLEPAIQTAIEGEAEVVNDMSVDIITDRSKYTSYVAETDIYTRLSSDIMETLAPNDYGRIMPYVGGFSLDAEGNTVPSFGLVSEDGLIVLDPVLVSAEFSTYEVEGETYYYDIIILGKVIDGETMYAICGGRGTWCTDFIFTSVFSNEIGTIGVTDLTNNYAICYDEAGAELFNTSWFSELYRLKDGTIESIEECSEGYMKIIFTNDQVGFINSSGYILNRGSDLPSYFDDAGSFSEGLLAINNYGAWSYLDQYGSYEIYASFSYAGEFKGGYAAIIQDGAWKIIDTEGEAMLVFDTATDVEVFENYISVEFSDGSYKYYTTSSLTEINMYDKELNLTAEAYWVEGAAGVRMRTFSGEEIYFSGAVSLIKSQGDLYLLELADGSYAVMDEYSRVSVHGEALDFVVCRLTGETYIMATNDEGITSLYNSNGNLVVDGIFYGENNIAAIENGVISGLYMCKDSHSVGYKNSENEWIFRIKLDDAD